MTDIYIIGGGGHARVMKDIVLSQDVGLTVAGYILHSSEEQILDKHILEDDFLRNYIGANVVIGVGDMDARKKIIIKYSYKFNFTTLVHKTAYIAPDVRLGRGTTVCANVTINPNTTIGSNCVINTGAIVEHDCTLGNNVFVAPGACILGGCVIGDNSFIGANATVIEQQVVPSEHFLKATSRFFIKTIKT